MRLREQRLVHKLYSGEQPLLRGDRAHDCKVPATLSAPCHTPKQRTITVWPSDAVPALQDCFQRTDWQIFREAAACEGEVDLEDYTSAVLGYISKCTEDVTPAPGHSNWNIRTRNPG
ncbi:hypothetical protein L3Q82_000397 [Scortum barcoo]|uniref:Uncharacterized protein n=1 Tax=Scortum barcoo TaxID=214431 RepID=A0ACB8XBC9_9TELE|nr:hypothetical protein L3Q82_000397 [Scortum barcoo]